MTIGSSHQPSELKKKKSRKLRAFYVNQVNGTHCRRISHDNLSESIFGLKFKIIQILLKCIKLDEFL